MQIITCHINADFDSLASMIAAKKLYPQAVIVFPGSQERKVRDFFEVFHPVEITRIRDIDLDKVDRLIIVDAKQPDRIGPLAPLLGGRKIDIHIYDHHPLEPGDIHGSVEKVEEVGATATIFTEILKARRLDPTPMEATVMALGIYEETGSLMFPSTTERDLLAAAYLLKRGANLNIVSSYMRMDLTMEELDLLNELVKASSETVVNGIRVVVTGATRESYVGDAAHLAHKLMDMQDIDAVFLLLDMEGKILIVGRSRVPELDAGEVLSDFGGGGHPTAGSATIREASLDVAADRLRSLLPRYVRPGKKAADVMTSPVIAIPWDSTIKEAEDTLTRYGVNVLPILRDGRYTGLISREIVEKALFHGFKKNRCIEFSTSDAVTVEADTPIRDIETIMIEQNQRFMPVLADGIIIGAITRTDLLRVIYEDFLRKRRLDKGDTIERTSPGRNLASWLKERFPDNVRRLLVTAGETADAMGFNAYLVGGSVRDLLMGQANLDIDIVVEGDGIAFARSLAERTRTRVRSHARFGTANLILDGLKIDVATARTEYYESPGALPTVEMSSIKKDLYRRDFTINTLALKLNPRDFGMLIDFFGGQRDIRDKTIRVLHNLSYVEDPTRAFRAIRFAERFGFKLSRHTENLIKSALQMNLFERLSGSRLYEELMLAFSETNPVRTLKRLSAHGLLKVIHSAIVFDERLEAALSSLYETIAWHNLSYQEVQPDTGILYLMALLSGLGDQERDEALRRIDAPPPAREMIMKAPAEQSRILSQLPLTDPAALYHLLEHVDLEVLLFTMASARNDGKKREISQFLIEMRKTRPLLGGDDLRAMGIPPGPLYSTILRELLDERLRGRLATADDERRYVRKHYPPHAS